MRSQVRRRRLLVKCTLEAPPSSTGIQGHSGRAQMTDHREQSNAACQVRQSTARAPAPIHRERRAAKEMASVATHLLQKGDRAGVLVKATVAHE
eukprot:scaffold39883_cov36-Tisochrysis_lutea.AAC.2